MGLVAALRSELADIVPSLAVLCDEVDARRLRYQIDRFDELVSSRLVDTPAGCREVLRIGVWIERDIARAIASRRG